MANQRIKRDCEICEQEEFCTLHNNMWICDKCWVDEQRAKVEAWKMAQAQAQAPVVANESHISPLPMNSILRDASQVDSTIQVRSDIFNAKTAEIKALKAAIDADDSITNKPYHLAEVIKTRFMHLKQVIFEQNQIIIDAGNEQKAIQIYLNELANKLRAEEREKLKIQDINYQPAKPKLTKVKTDSVNKPPKKVKADKAAIAALAVELGISNFTVAMVVNQKGSVEKAKAYFISIRDSEE